MNILSILCILAKIKTVLSRVLRGGVAGNLIPSPVDTISLRHFLPPSPCSAPDDNFNMPGQFFCVNTISIVISDCFALTKDIEYILYRTLTNILYLENRVDRKIGRRKI